jgi:DNA-binding SARP family transcriptional activator/tetratricopeptide (TPR) repeat protein
VVWVPVEVEFGLLGPLEVRRGDVLVPVAAGRQRAVLTALLLHAGRVVSVDELIEVLWQAGPPPAARASLQNYVRRLRTALGDEERRLIGTRPGGYQINVGPGGLDVTRFEELLGAARAAAQDGVWDGAADRAAAALALWRGEPLTDTGSAVLAAREAPWLAELRWQALELRIDAELRLGRHAGVIGELRGLVAGDPLRERWHALLMLALHRDGRQGEALAAYQQARGVLAEELGAEPGAGLRELHQRILTDDPALAVAGAGPGVAAGTVATRTLPRDIPSFIGRRDELARLTGARADAGAVVGIQAIGGMAGVGKTAFAVHAAHRLMPRFPDGQLFVPLHGHTPGRRPVEPAEALAALLLTTGLTAAQIPPGLEERAGLWRDRLAGRRVLLVLDDAMNSAQAAPLLPGTSGCLVLVTSRRHLTALADAEVISLDVLPPKEAAALLVRLAARPGLAPGDAAVAKICALCGYLPLAIGMVARRLHHHPAWTPAGLAADLAAAKDRLELMTAENLSVAAGLDLSYADLTTGQKRLFRRLGLHPGGDIDAYAAAAVDGCSMSAARAALAALYDNYLLAEPAAGRYRLHDLIREHARTLAVQHDPAGDRDQALARLLDYYTHTATLAEVHLARQTRPTPAPTLTAPPCAVPDLTDSTQALAWARAERVNLLACLDHATDVGQHARVVALTASLAGLLRHDGLWADAVTRHDTAVRAAERCGDRPGQANALNNLAIVRSLTGDHLGATQALEAALALARDLGDRLGQANALNNLGHVRYLTDDYQGAAQALEAALALARDLGDRLGQANALNNLGAVRYLTGDYRDAAQALEAALALARDVGDRLGQANALNYLGHVRRMTGDYSGAAQALEAALALARDLGDRLAQANALNNLGHVRRMTGDYSGAAQALEAALALARDLGHRLAQANALAVLGGVRRLTGDYPGAAGALEDALSIYRDLGERGGAAEALNESGTLYRTAGNLNRAEACHRQALTLAHEIGSSYDQAHALAGLGRCALAAGRPADAEPSLRQARRIFQRIATAESTTMAAELDAFAENRLAAPRGHASAFRAGHDDALAWRTDSAGVR